MINCSRKENFNRKECKKSVGEGVFSIILPKGDNSRNKINTQIHSKYIQMINNHFGGSTTKPVTLGCYKDPERNTPFCEEGLQVMAFRDFDSPYDQKLQKLNLEKRKQKLKDDFDFMQKLAKESAIELGQDSVPVIYDNVADISYMKGLWKKEIDKEKLSGDKISENIWEKYI